jgi:hypothetical protein
MTRGQPVQRPLELPHRRDERHENHEQARDPGPAQQPPLPGTNPRLRNQPGRVERDGDQHNRHHVPEVDGNGGLIEPADQPPAARVGEQPLTGGLNREQEPELDGRVRQQRDRRRIRVLHDLAGHADHVDRERPQPDKSGQRDQSCPGERVGPPPAAGQRAILPGKSALVDSAPAEQVVHEPDDRHPPADQCRVEQPDAGHHHGRHGQTESPVQPEQAGSEQDEQQVHRQEP